MSGQKYQTFIFKSYHFDRDTKTIKLNYGFDDQLSFTETITFDFPIRNYEPTVLDRAIQGLFFIAGVSYYKAFRTDQIRVDHGSLSRSDAKFFAEVYQQGLGEYFYVNKLDPRTDIPFIANGPDAKPVQHQSNDGKLIGIGGGKDSLVTVELLRDQPNVATWSLGHRQQLEPLIRRIGLPHFWVERQIDPQIIELNSQGALNGHVPISAILAGVGTVVAILTGYRDNIVSNENSANEPTLVYDGVEINHQYSKSLVYERAYQKYLAENFGDSIRYYSALRPLSEVRIAEIFSHAGFDKYKAVFSSCNRAFVQVSNRMSWCGVCNKCAFVFLALTPFVERQELEKLWHKNLLLDPNHVTTYENLLGIGGDKPLDCVGEIKESREAMRLAQTIYDGLNYEFDIPADYSYKNLADHSMPVDVWKIIEPAVADV